MFRRLRTVEEIEREMVRQDLDRAVILGNLYEESVKLHYVDQWGLPQEEEAKVLAATERYAMLKGGTSIPIQRISKVTI